MTPELEKKIEEAADADFIVGKTRPIGTRERYLYEEKRESFLNGVSFGKKGMYTEEEVYNIAAQSHSHGYSLCLGSTDDILEFPEWFELNKKK